MCVKVALSLDSGSTGLNTEQPKLPVEMSRKHDAELETQNLTDLLSFCLCLTALSLVMSSRYSVSILFVCYCLFCFFTSY